MWTHLLRLSRLCGLHGGAGVHLVGASHMVNVTFTGVLAVVISGLLVMGLQEARQSVTLAGALGAGQTGVGLHKLHCLVVDKLDEGVVVSVVLVVLVVGVSSLLSCMVPGELSHGHSKAHGEDDGDFHGDCL